MGLIEKAAPPTQGDGPALFLAGSSEGRGSPLKIPCDKRREAASSQAPYGACDDAAESLEGETSERLYKGEEEKKRKRACMAKTHTHGARTARGQWWLIMVAWRRLWQLAASLYPAHRATKKNLTRPAGIDLID